MKVYKLGLVGESNYQAAIERCHAGESVRFYHEPDNPYDGLALRVENDVGEIIGYVAKSSWLRTAIHEEGRGVAATVRAVQQSNGGLMGVVLDVTLTDDPIFERAYNQPTRQVRDNTQQAANQDAQSSSGFISGLFKGLFK